VARHEVIWVSGCVALLILNCGLCMKVSGRIYVRLTPVTAPALSTEIRGGMEARKKREIYCFCWESNNDFSVVQPVARSMYQLSLSWVHHEIIWLPLMLWGKHDVLWTSSQRPGEANSIAKYLTTWSFLRS